MKKILTGVLSLMISASAFAGGLLTNTNQNVAFLRNPAQEGTIGIDALYSNPAGIAFLSEGFHLSLNWQMAAQQRIMTTTSPVFAAGIANNGATTKEFKGKAFSPIMPSFHAAYVFNEKWSASAAFTVTGGGGACEFENGLPMFEYMVGGPLALQSAQYSMEQNLTGEQYLFGLQLGGTYKVTDNVSVFGGVRTVFASNAYEGTIKNIMLKSAATGGQLVPGAMVNPSLADYVLDCSQSTIGFTPIVGVDVNLGRLNLAAKYEFRTKLEYENESENSANVDAAFADYKDGAKVRNDVPAILTLGAEYSVLPSLRVAAGYTHYFDNDAKGSTTNVSDNTWEASFGVEYDINDKWLVSTGVRHTNYGFADNEVSDLNFNMDNYALGIGGAYKVNEKVTVNAGYMHSFYSDHNTPANAVGLATIYERKNDTWGVGVDIKF
ncbi:MAG: outer membrane protein transport protein [Bacteroidaceae bacterium]|nr:outer membrane protein transport protein [Bacteroidaceae bacterium]